MHAPHYIIAISFHGVTIRIPTAHHTSHSRRVSQSMSESMILEVDDVTDALNGIGECLMLLIDSLISYLYSLSFLSLIHI